jgi:hypothetical protein
MWHVLAWNKRRISGEYSHLQKEAYPFVFLAKARVGSRSHLCSRLSVDVLNRTRTFAGFERSPLDAYDCCSWLTMIGKRVRLTDSDNYRFGLAMPAHGAEGIIAKRVALEDWGDDWYVVDLDSPILFDNVSHERVLIRSRMIDHALGDVDPTWVFVLLIPDPAVFQSPRLSSSDFYHVSWCNAHTGAVA